MHMFFGERGISRLYLGRALFYIERGVRYEGEAIWGGKDMRGIICLIVVFLLQRV